MLVLVLLVYQFTPKIVLIVTNKGEVVVRTNQPVQVVFKQDGKTVQETEAGPGLALKVPTGDYDVEVTVREHGRAVVMRKRITVGRGGSLDLDIRQMLAEYHRTDAGTQRALAALHLATKLGR